jgi:hypothetical protein
MGNLSVSNVRGGLVRAHISSEGDITLTNISAENVAAENGIGDIFYDGTIQSAALIVLLRCAAASIFDSF